MQNEQSGARKQHKPKENGEVLSPTELAAVERGQLLKRYVRAAAALQGLFEDVEIGSAVGVSRGTVGGWWRGARPEPTTLRRLADATGLATDELTAFVHYEGPPPALPMGSGPSGLLEGVRRAGKPPSGEGPGTPAPSPERRPRGDGARRG